MAKEKAAGRHYRTRVERLRQRIVDAPREVCVERARYLTESMAANWDLHPLTRMSMARRGSMTSQAREPGSTLEDG